MPADVTDASSPADAGKALRAHPIRERLAVPPGEHEVRDGMAWQVHQDLVHVGIQRQVPHASALGRRDDASHDGLAHGEDAGVDVDDVPGGDLVELQVAKGRNEVEPQGRLLGSLLRGLVVRLHVGLEPLPGELLEGGNPGSPLCNLVDGFTLHEPVQEVHLVRFGSSVGLDGAPLPVPLKLIAEDRAERVGDAARGLPVRLAKDDGDDTPYPRCRAPEDEGPEARGRRCRCHRPGRGVVPRSRRGSTPRH